MISSPSSPSPRSRAWVEVDLAAVKSNGRVLVERLGPGCALMAVVKADAYGHGLVPIARAALAAGARWLGVATVAEGCALRAAGIAAPIALLSSPPPQEAPDVVANGLTPLVGDRALVQALGATGGGGLVVHLDVDTGMGRSGVLPEGAVDLWRAAVGSGLTVTGLCTHFADADGELPDMTHEQWSRFAQARSALEAAGASFDWVHAGNSAALLRFPAHGCNLARPGLLLYGLLPAQPPSGAGEGAAIRDRGHTLGAGGVRPVLTLKARIGAVRDLPAGHTISYGATYRLARPSRLATLLIGYGDGFPRRLSNGGEVLLRGRRAPILGRVCMDQTVVDVTDIPGAAPSDVAVCIGTDGGNRIRAEEIARQIETTEHEITTCLTARLPRIYLDADNDAESA